MILAGRGWGKTRTGAEDIGWYAGRWPNTRLAVVAPTFTDGRDTCVEGVSGLLSVIPPQCIRAWNRSVGELVLWNGSRIKIFSAEEPERLRGPQFHRAWCDELAAWKYPETWDQLMFGLRLGTSPQAVVTTTPRPIPLVRQILADARTKITRGATMENVGNLAASAVEQLRKRYEGTRLGRQELLGELLDDVPGALWTRKMVDAARRPGDVPDFARVVVAVDPSGSSGKDGTGANSIGIVAAARGVDGKAYVLEDATCDLSPAGWGRRAVDVYQRRKADRIVAERNFGGAMVEHVIRTVDPRVSYSEVVASRGKVVRAEPVAALYEQGLVRHIGPMSDLEDQMCAMTGDGFLGEGSPDRVDALVWALTELMLKEAAPTAVVGAYRMG